MRKVTRYSGRQGSRRNSRDMRQLSARLCHISHASHDDRVVSPSPCEPMPGTRRQLPAARCAAMRYIPWRCSVFSLGSPFFATRALLRPVSAIPRARARFQRRAFRIETLDLKVPMINFVLGLLIVPDVKLCPGTS